MRCIGKDGAPLERTSPNDAVLRLMYRIIESIQIIASSMTRDEWRGFCIGNSLKCRIDAKNQKDLYEAESYESMFKKYEGLNRAKR